MNDDDGYVSYLMSFTLQTYMDFHDQTSQKSVRHIFLIKCAILGYSIRFHSIGNYCIIYPKISISCRSNHL